MEEGRRSRGRQCSPASSEGTAVLTGEQWWAAALAVVSGGRRPPHFFPLLIFIFWLKCN
jgi:hypothetical protein